MAAAQCRSGKCTAERKGFRRELDSWRHRLIHCVGFESILEGIYGPLLLRDLNIFDDCEPEEVDDWTIEASCSYCSFCNLPLDKLTDQCPAAASPLSSPSEYSPSQAPSNSEGNLTAHTFLQAVFHKKDVPLNCDSNIPLVAQELMKKMIHQFALEYASKSHLHTTTNGPSTDTTSSPSDDADPDAPLDLTVNRKQETTREPLPDGVLDLSKRNSACSAASSSSSHKASGFPVAVTEESRRDPALEAVLRSLCPAHRSLLYQILKLAYQERLLPLPQKTPAAAGQNESHCCHHGVVLKDNAAPLALGYGGDCRACGASSPHYQLSDCDHHVGSKNNAFSPADSKKPSCSAHHPCHFTDCKNQAAHGSAGCCCVQSCGVATYPVICLKNLYCIACQSLAVGRVNKVVCSFATSSSSSPPLSASPSLCSTSVCPASSLCCNHPCHRYSNRACGAPAAEGAGPEDGDPPCPVLKREQSPSPPPLSPIPSDINKDMEEKPPSLQRHRDEEGEGDASLRLEVKDVPVHASGQGTDLATEEDESVTSKRDRAEPSSSGRLELQDVVERFNEKLETIRPLEKDPPPPSSSAVHRIGKQCPLTPQANRNSQSPADEHLSDIITTVLHKGSDSDYDLSELLHRHDSSEAKSPNTRSRRRQEALAAMATPRDPAINRRHTLQIKRELAMLDQSYCKRKLLLPKKARLKDGNNVASTTFSIQDIIPPEEKPEGESGMEESKGQEVVNITAVLGTECDMLGVTGGKELARVTEMKEGKSCAQHKLVKCLKESEREEEQPSEIKEEIETVIVTEEIEMNNIKLEVTDKEIPTARNDHFSLCSPAPATERQNKADIHVGKKEKETPGCSSACDKDRNQERASAGQCDSDNIPASTCQHRPVGKTRKAMSQSGSSRQAGRSRRNIVPPQRFSSYVTEPRKMYFVACFTENIFNQRPTKDSSLNAVNSDISSTNPSVADDLPESRDPAVLSSFHPTAELTSESTPDKQFRSSEPEEQQQGSAETVVATEKSHSKPSAHYKRDGGTRLQSLPVQQQKAEAPRTRQKRNCSSNSPDTCVKTHDPDYTSPIKLMYVSPVMDEKGLKYSLKSAVSGSSGRLEEAFDPCEESSWAGSPEKDKCPSSLNSASSSPKSVSTPAKSVTTPSKSATTPPKSATTPPKSIRTSPNSVATPPRSVRMSTKSVGTPPKSPRASPKSVGTPPKSPRASPKSVGTPPKSASTPPKSVGTPPKSVGTPPRPGRTPPKSPSTPPKSLSTSPKSPYSPARSPSLSPKVCTRRSGDSVTPPKRTVGIENHRPDVPLAVHETTPPKRRPGRPKKLGPQLEKKAKRPPGRPRKQKGPDQVKGGPNAETLKSISGSDTEEKTNKNLKITVFYGRSRRNKRLVSESDSQLHTELHEDQQCVDRSDDTVNLLHISEAKPALQELNLVRPVKDKECAPHSSSNIKCPRRQDSVPMRRPGRPAKVKISGISVTFTPVSPRQRKIQINRDARQSPETLSHKKVQVPVPDALPAKEPQTINPQTETGATDQSTDKPPERPVPVRHSVRVRKPSIYLLHSVATSTPKSYSRSTALLRRSKQLLLNKASNQRRREEAQGDEGPPGGKNQVKNGRKRTCQDVHRMAKVSVDSIFPPGDTLRWWAASADENTLNRELARRIRLVSDTWVSDAIENQEEAAFKTRLGIKSNSSVVETSGRSSVVRMLFDCPPSKPRSCSMQQLCSWFMQTTETQSLSITKNTSSRNRYEHMHYPRSTSNGSFCRSPQAERLRKHIKKFAKTVPKSPSEHQRAQKRMLDRRESTSSSSHKRQLFTSKLESRRLNQGAPWWRGRKLAKYPATLMRARTRFLTAQERMKRPKRQRNNQRELKWRSASGLNDRVSKQVRPRGKAFSRSATDLVDCLESDYTTSSGDQTDPMSVPKEQEPWSPERLKKCSVMLRKFNSPGPDNGSAAEEGWNSCTVTLDDGSSSAHHVAGKKRELAGENKAVKRGNRKKRKKRPASIESESCTSKASQEQDEVAAERQNDKWKSPAVVFEPPQPPPAKMLRQSRVRGLTGPRWRDFVVGS